MVSLCPVANCLWFPSVRWRTVYGFPLSGGELSGVSSCPVGSCPTPSVATALSACACNDTKRKALTGKMGKGGRGG